MQNRASLSLARLQLGLLAGASHRALDEAVGPRLGGVHLGVLAGVLEALVPAEIYQIVSKTISLSFQR